MTDNTHGASPGPPWSVDVLADLHAGALDPETSARLWPQVNADPQARAVIEALETVKVELRRLGGAPAAPMPAAYAARLDAALDAEARRSGAVAAPPAPGAAPVVDIAEARRRRNRRMGWGAGLLAAAAAAAAITVAVYPGDKTSGSPQAGPTPPAQTSAPGPPVALRGDNLAAAIGALGNKKDYGPLANQERLDQCIRANGHDPETAQTIAVAPVTLDGKDGVAALLTTGKTGIFRLLIVAPTCGPDNPGQMADTELRGRR
jgi:hypothetical protein